MEREYWNGLADTYEDEVFSVLENDKQNLICGLIEKYGSSEKTVNDFGCGIGHFLGILSDSFGLVNAIDISYRFIQRAKEKYSRLNNINYFTTDVANNGLKIEKADFALCVNMLIMPSLKCRLKILDVIINSILKDGHLLLVTPAIESVMLTNYRLTEMNLRDGLEPAAAIRANFTDPKTYSKNLRRGIIPIDGVPTKHYLKEELYSMLESRNMNIIDICKIEYSWDTEFSSPPKWMKAPYPWDWLVLAQKK
ncbi:MAG: hypothetical protein A2Y10_16980 [Planctomycetes bacterium GWF2_41_51]|nr:MAG: hypothetical protein A2Y10_16980 [Planctomycetes bacterium GWF2_41_51]HBG28075.1 class I SAM-dependent methyltransferase [Phycisphaerales bacterium]